MKWLVIVAVVVLIGVSGVATASPWRRAQAPSREECAYGYGYYGYSYYGYGYRPFRHGWDRYLGYERPYGYPNVNIRYKERWDVYGGESSYEQTPSLDGKIIDGLFDIGKILALKSIFR